MATPPDSETSITLLERLRDDPTDPRAWERFVARYRPRIVVWCQERGLQPADAEDVAQSVLTKLLHTMKQFKYDPSRSFRAWLKTVTIHACGDLVSQPRPATGDDALRILDPPDSRDALAQRIDEEFDRERLELAIEQIRGRVAPNTWEAFRLTALEGLSGAQAAHQLGMPVANVFVAKQRVRKMLEEEIRLRESP